MEPHADDAGLGQAFFFFLFFVGSLIHRCTGRTRTQLQATNERSSAGTVAIWTLLAGSGSCSYILRMCCVCTACFAESVAAVTGQPSGNKSLVSRSTR